MATLFFSSSNWTDSTPFGLDQDSYGGDGKKFNRLTTTVELPSTDHRIVKVSISQSISPGYDAGYITFTSPDKSSISTLPFALANLSGNELFTPVISTTSDNRGIITHTRWFEVNSYNGATTDIFVNINGPATNKTTLLNLHIDIGANLNYTNANEEVNVVIDCDYNTPIEYTAGLHPYSPYDAKDGSSTYRTKVWSLAALGPGTYLYADALLSKPALPYYYGIGSTVYQVGEELDRNYGTVLKVKVKPRLFADPKTEYRYIGPTSNWYQKGKKRKEPTTKLIRGEWHDDSSYDYTPMNIEPFVPSIGKISRTYANASIPQPSVYRYYVTSNNESVFKAAQKWRYYDLGAKSHHTMNGGFNALYHLATAYSNALTTQPNDGTHALFIDGTYLSLLVRARRDQDQDVYDALLSFSSVLLIGEIIAVASGAAGGLLTNIIWSLFATGAAANPIAAIVILVIVIVILLINIFKKTWLIEPQPALKNVFSSSPTISNGDNLYKKDDLATEIDSGIYYSNGLDTFLYSGNVSGKTYVYTVGLVGFDFEDGNKKIFKNEAPLGIGRAFATLFDSTEDPTVWKRLITLPYEAGKPVPGKTITAATLYTSVPISSPVTYNVGTFERTVVNSVELEEGLLTSYVSQADADAKANIMLSASRAFITGSTTPGDLENEYVVSGSLFYFTHTIKVENNPKVLPLYWTGSLTAGTVLYYDEGGRNKVLNGYYSTGSAGSNYRDFFLVESGSILKSEVMATAGSTSTVSGQPVDTTNLNFTSGWAISDQSKSTVYAITERVLNAHLYDTSQLLANNSAKRIIISGSNRISDNSSVKVYAGSGINSTGSFNSQTTGWYTDITRWSPGQQREVLPTSVYSRPSKTITPFFKEDCSWQEGANERGVYVEFRSASAFTTALNPVDLAFEVNTSTATLGTYRTTVPGNVSRHFVPIINDDFTPGDYFTSITLSGVFSPNPNKGVTIYTGSAILSSTCQAPAGGSETVFISAIRNNCDDLCWQSGDTSYLVNNSSNSTETYALITEGTYITDVAGNVPNYIGYVAVAASSTQTSDTSNVKILEVDNFGIVTSIIQCSGGSCSNPL